MRGSSPMSTQSALTSSKPASCTRDVRIREQHERVRATVRRVIRRKERADVAEAGGAEQCIGERMGDHVTVGVADEPTRMVDRDAAEHERNAFAERVRVQSDRYSDTGCRWSWQLVGSRALPERAQPRGTGTQVKEGAHGGIMVPRVRMR